MRRASLALLVTAGSVWVVGCGGSPPAQSRAQGEVRALVAEVSAEGRAHEFARICEQEMWGVLRQLAYLTGQSCPKLLAQEWAEGVQLQHVGAEAKVVVSGNHAVIDDGRTPDRAIQVRGQWLLAELPRNRRLARRNEAGEVLKSVEKIPGVKINHETGAVEPPALAPPATRRVRIARHLHQAEELLQLSKKLFLSGTAMALIKHPAERLPTGVGIAEWQAAVKHDKRLQRLLGELPSKASG